MAAGMDFAAARGKVRKMLAPVKPQELSKSSLTPDALRDNIIEEHARDSERFIKARNKFPELDYTDEQGQPQKHVWESFPEAMNDYARAAFEYDEPAVRPRDQIRPSHRLNREVIQAALNSPAFQESRPYTRDNEDEAIYGAMAAGDSLRVSAQGVLAEHIKHSEQIGEAEQDLRGAEQMFDDLRQQARQEIGEHGEVLPGTRRQIKQALKGIDAAQAGLQNLMGQQLTGAMIVDAIAAGEAAAQAAAEAVEAFSNIPGLTEGQRQRLSVDAQIKLAEKWRSNQDLREIIRLVGRMLRSFRFKRSARVKNVDIEPVGVKTGNDLQRLLPHEAARGFSDNRLVKTTFVKDFVERQLLQYDMRGKAPAGKGAGIAVYDGSGSMAGERFRWCSSLVLTLQMQMYREKRNFAAVEYGTGRELASWYFPKGVEPDPDQVLEMTGHFFGGGTDITIGMREALRILTDEPAFKVADIVLVSDGADTFAKDDLTIQKRLQAMGVRVHGISIMAPRNTYLNQMCDYVVDVVDLANNDALHKLAENIH